MLIRSLGIALIALPTLAALPSATGRSGAQQSPITDVTLNASPSKYTGHCPVLIRFVGRIHATKRAEEMRYQFTRSDGAKGAWKLVRVAPRADIYIVYDRWQLGSAGQHLQVWEKLNVTMGDAKAESNQADVEVNCN